MVVIIAGSRTINDYNLLLVAISEFQSLYGPITEVVSGGAKGVDSMGERWAKENSLPIKRFLPNWSLGKKAGPLRNMEMGDYADACIVVYDGSRGSQHMADYAKSRGLKLYTMLIGKPL